MRAIFMGTPEFAVPSLEATARVCELVAVVAQPDRPRGRGQRAAAPPTAQWATAHAVPLLQPPTLRESAALDVLRALAPDVIVVAAYGKILPPALLLLPPFGCVNVHASLLPRWRGAAPVAWAIAQGDVETGVTIMKMDEGLDTGPIFWQERLAIAPGDTGGALTQKLALLGAGALVRLLERLASGEPPRPNPQDQRLATLAPRLRREDARVDWALSARELHDRIRAFQPWPGARCILPGGKPLKILATSVEPGEGKPGEVTAADPGGIHVATGEGILRLVEVQPEGARRMPAAAFLAGHRLAAGERLD